MRMWNSLLELEKAVVGRYTEGGMESTQDKVRGEDVKTWAKRIVKEGRVPRQKEHQKMTSDSPNIYTFTVNTERNRYQNIVLYDSTRVKLAQTARDDTSYIHATWVSDKNFILTQGPMDNTALDFWRMVWQEKVCVIVCLCPMKNDEESFQYWPSNPGKTLKFGGSRLEIRNKNEKKRNRPDEADFKTTDLLVTCREKDKQERRISHLHYTAWPEDKQSPESIVKFIEEMWAQKTAMETMTNTTKTPIVVHCSSGARRSGTFAALSLCCRELSGSGKVDVKGVVSRIKKERYGCLTESAQYLFIYKSLLYFAQQRNLISKNDPTAKRFLNDIRKVDAEEKSETGD